MKHDPTLLLQRPARRPPFPFSRAAPQVAPQVAVLLAIHDHARVLPAHLEAIARQTHRTWSLVIRDDGSRDDGPDLARAFAATMPGRDIRLIGGPHLGASRGMLALVAEADPMADFAVLATPGASWEPDRIARAVSRLSEGPADRPAMCCAFPVTTARGGPGSFANALAQSLPPGSVPVVNRAALDLLRIAAKYRGPIPSANWWCYQLVTGAGGRVVADRVSRSRAVTPADRRFAVLDRRYLRWRDENLTALRAAGPLLTGGNRRTLEAVIAARDETGSGRGMAGTGLRLRGPGGDALLRMAGAFGRR